MLKMFKKNKKGFTLTELMVVVAIIGILTAIAVPVYNGVTDNANRRAVEANLRTIDGAIMQHQANNPGVAPTAALLTGTYIKAWPVGPEGTTYQVIGAGTQAAPYGAQATLSATCTWGTASSLKTLPVTWP